MATLSFTVPAPALAALDEYAQRRNYADFRALAVEWMKNSARNAKREKNAQDAAVLLSEQPVDPNIT